jgi:hypothetical protein
LEVLAIGKFREEVPVTGARMKQIATNLNEVQKTIELTQAAQFAAYNEMADVSVSFKSLEEEFLSRLALVEDLQKRFHFMMTELKSAGLRTED